jgi:electron transport complex protein RnfA
VNISLAVLGGLFLNLTLQMGLGIKEVWTEFDKPIRNSFFECIILFIAVIIEWLIFTYILSPLNIGFLKYFAIFPFSAAIAVLFDTLIKSLPFKFVLPEERIYSFQSVSGLCVAAVLITLCLASKISDALILDLGFSLGTFVSIVILKAIRLRVANENTSSVLRGLPLMLISLGLLSLVWTSAALVYLSTKGTY